MNRTTFCYYAYNRGYCNDTKDTRQHVHGYGDFDWIFGVGSCIVEEKTKKSVQRFRLEWWVGF